MIKLVNRKKMNPATRRRARITAPKAARTATTLPKTVKSRRLDKEDGGNGKEAATPSEMPTIEKKCGKAPAAKAGGQRRSFPAPPKPGSLVRLIKKRCNASIHCDIIGEEGLKKTSMDVLCDTVSDCRDGSDEAGTHCDSPVQVLPQLYSFSLFTVVWCADETGRREQRHHRPGRGKLSQCGALLW